MLWTKKPKTELQFRPKSKINGMLPVAIAKVVIRKSNAFED